MKKILLLIVLLASATRCQSYTITNFDAMIDTSWVTNVIPKLNENNNNFVAWLNGDDLTNEVHDARFVADESAFTNHVAIFQSYTNFVGTNIVGLTTNIQFTDTAVLGGYTNTLYFTNGILKAVTSP
jgi:hypothetical protein